MSVVILAGCALACAVAGCGSTVATSTGPSPTKCAVTLAGPADPVTSDGATATVAITTQPECAWSASSGASWLTGLTPASGQGSGQLQFQVSANPNAATRQADVLVNGERAHISQDAAPCRFELSSTEQTIPASGGTARVAVAAAGGCAWTAHADASWIAITAGTTGTGTGSVAFTIVANSGLARTASVAIADQTVQIKQEGLAPPPPLNCSYTVSPQSVSVGSTGATAMSESVNAPAGCVWSAASNVSWMSITAGASSSGNGMVTFSVAANTGVARTGTLTIADETVTVTQAVSSSCSYAVKPLTVSVPSTDATSTSLSITAAMGCTWTSISTVAWMSVTSGSTGNGNGTTTFNVAANTGAARTGTLTVAGQTVTVSQAAAPCSYSVSPTSLSIGTVGGTGTPISVSTSSFCAWTATSGVNWVSILTGANNTGPGSVTYSVQPNTGAARTGTLTVAGHSVTISQNAACTYAVSPTSQTLEASGGNVGPVPVTTQSGCAWTAASNASWITVTSGASGTGSGSFTFSVAANNTGAARTGTLTIAGVTFTVTEKK